MRKSAVETLGNLMLTPVGKGEEVEMIVVVTSGSRVSPGVSEGKIEAPTSRPRGRAQGGDGYPRCAGGNEASDRVVFPDFQIYQAIEI